LIKTVERQKAVCGMRHRRAAVTVRLIVLTRTVPEYGPLPKYRRHPPLYPSKTFGRPNASVRIRPPRFGRAVRRFFSLP